MTSSCMSSYAKQRAAAGKRPAGMNLLLHLKPPQLEQEFWASPDCIRIYTRWDVLALLYAVFINFALLRMFWSNLFNPALWHFTLQFSLYFITAIMQLGIMFRNPRSHQQHRMKIMAAHRLARALFMGLSAVASNPAHTAAVAGTLTSSGSKAFMVPGNAWVKLLRTVLSHPLVAMAPSHFLLPVRYVVPLQIATLVFTLRMSGGQPCIIAQEPDLQGVLQQACRMMAGVMHISSVALWRPGTVCGLAAPEAEQLCSSNTTAAVLLVLYAHMVLIVLVPCVVLYKIERSLKQSFLQSKQLHGTAFEQPVAAAAAAAAGKPASEFDRESEQSEQGLLLFGNVLMVLTGGVACWYACIAVVMYLPELCTGWPQG